MPTGISNYIFALGGKIGVYVRLVNNNTSIAYTSPTATGIDGKYSIPSSIPAGYYTVWTSVNGVDFTVTPDTLFIVPYTDGDDIHVATITADSSLKLKNGPWIDPTHLFYGAKFDLQNVSDVSTTAGSPVITSVSGKFKTTDQGKIAWAIGTGYNGLFGSGTIVSVQSPTQATLSFNALNNSTNQFFKWGTDDSAAMQSWLNAIIPSSSDLGQLGGAIGKWGAMPAGACLINAPLTKDQANLGAFKVTGAGMGGFGGAVTLLVPGPAMIGLDLITISNMRNAKWEDFDIDGTLCARGIVSVMGTPGPAPAPASGETSTNCRFTDIDIRSCSSWGLYLDGHEDTLLTGVHINPGNLDRNALFWNIPNGSGQMFGCNIAGVSNLCYQEISCFGGTYGPIRTNNPNSLTTLTLTLSGTYNYDSANHYCLEAIDQFTDVIAFGGFFIASNQLSWVRGKVILGVTLKFDCGFLQSGASLNGQNVPIFCVTADGAGAGCVIFGGACSATAYASFQNINRKTFQAINGSNATAITLSTFSNGFQAPNSFIASGVNAPNTGTWTPNPYPVAMEIFVDRNGATVAAGWFAVSPDGGTTVQDCGIPPAALNFSKIIRPGQSYRFTYSAGQSKYGACWTA